jgi:hypothetical protein
MSGQAAELAQHLARQAEDVCRYYLPKGRRNGRYWLTGDVHDTPGRSLYVRLAGPESGPGAAGHWSDYVAQLIMLRICDWVLSPRRLTASTQHNASALFLNEPAEARASLLGTGVLATLLERHPVVRIAEREVA